MKNYICFLLIAFFLTNNVNGGDTSSYSCKYRYIIQKDPTDKNSKFDDVMILTITKNSSIYYSYLKQYGYRNLEVDKKKLRENITTSESGGIMSVNASSSDKGKYFYKNETEIININFITKKIHFTDKLFSNSYEYNDELTSPKWKLESETIIILDQKCQKATTTFKGRNYTAWFAIGIPYNMGPWFFNGLPGLILKVHDDKKQIEFECIELNTSNISTKVFKPYTNLKKVSKKQLQLKKKFLNQDPLGFMEAEDGVTITSTDKNGAAVQRKLKPYNPIDLTQ